MFLNHATKLLLFPVESVVCALFQSGKTRRGKRWVGYYIPGGGQQQVSSHFPSLMVMACCVRHELILFNC